MSKRPPLSTLAIKGEGAKPEPLPAPSTATARVEGPQRKATTFKIRADVYARLRAASFHEERDKQDIVDEALDEWLAAKGYT